MCVCVNCPFVHLCCFWLICRNACYGMDIYSFPDRMCIEYFLPSCHLCICVLVYLWCFSQYSFVLLFKIFMWSNLPHFSFFLTSGFATKLGKAPRYRYRYRDTKIKTEVYDVCLLPGLIRLYMWDYLYTCVREGWQLRLYVLHIHSPILSFNLLIFYI